MRNIFFVLLLSFPSLVFGQVAKGAGVFYFTEAPTLTPNVCYDSEIGIDTSTGGGGAAAYLVYTALLSQSGTDAPTATVLQNTLGGTVVWTRDSAGFYLGTLAGAFTQNKTFVLVTHDGSLGATGYMGGGRNDGDSVFVTFQGQDGNFVDILGENAIEIRVYP